MIVRKKKYYKEFVKYVKEGRLNTFYKAAKDVGVNKETISRWFHSPDVRRAFEEDINKFVQNIHKPRLTWKGKTKWIDRLIKVNS